jgi:hypothetical protein
MDARTIARLIAASRVGIGLGLVVAPAPIARRWVGADGRRPTAGVLAMGLGARDLALGAGTLAALSGGEPRPWLIACATADAADLVATLRGRRALSGVAVAGVGLIAGGAAAVGAWLSAQPDW